MVVLVVVVNQFGCCCGGLFPKSLGVVLAGPCSSLLVQTVRFNFF